MSLLAAVPARSARRPATWALAAALAAFGVSSCTDRTDPTGLPGAARATLRRDYVNSTGVTVALSGPSYAYDQSVTVTASVSPTGSYYYGWQYQYCYNGNAIGDCDGSWHALPSGQDLANTQFRVYRQDYYVIARVTVSASASGPALATSDFPINGAGECSVPQGCNGGGAGGMY